MNNFDLLQLLIVIERNNFEKYLKIREFAQKVLFIHEIHWARFRMNAHELSPSERVKILNFINNFQ